MKDPWCVRGVASLGIRCAVHDAAYLRPSDSTSAHGAGFDGDVERSVRQVFATKGLCSGGDSLHLRMSGDVGEGFREVMSASDDLVIRDDDATDGDLVRG